MLLALVPVGLLVGVYGFELIGGLLQCCKFHVKILPTNRIYVLTARRIVVPYTACRLVASRPYAPRIDSDQNCHHLSRACSLAAVFYALQRRCLKIVMFAAVVLMELSARTKKLFH